ncbi:hypothetical protein CC80DRAFT_495950 [Byssothecium circinans]|uniref:Uncharacterized protein n=1 Tax=Byssothecium circinans TaxID=147558 RepID=A0A6A5TG36_9PLEO|nr:hypothetical protein CC80DRAFT_495950 [Byssothecium circinans]
MATACAKKASWLALSLLLSTSVLAQSSTSSRDPDAPYWTYTSRFMRSTRYTTYLYTYRTSTSTSTGSYSTTRTIKSGVTPTGTPTSTSTYDSNYYYSIYDLELIHAYYTQGAVADSDLVEEYNYYDSTSTTRTTTSTTSTTILYVMPVTWTQPSSCTRTSFSIVTTVTPTIPSQVRDQITPTSKVTGARNYNNYGTETWYLSAGAAPTTQDYYYRSYVARCTAPPGSGGSRSGGGSGGSSGSSSSSGIKVCAWYSGCTSLKVWVIIIASIIPGLFVLGFIESYFWFRRLMLGKGCLRFGTVLWIFLSLWVACFTRTQSARSKDDQKLLRENWNKIGTGKAIKLWFKWGFRHAYPVPILGQYSRNTVGIVPEGQPLPQMGQTNTPYMPPPGAPTATGIIYQNGQPYYAPPQGWTPPNGQGYPMPPPGTAYIPPQNGTPVYYGEHYGPPPQNDKSVAVSEAPVSPIQQNTAPQPVPSPISVPSNVPTPPAHYAEAYAPPPQQPTYTQQAPPSELSTISSPQPTPQAPLPQGPPPPHPT